MSSLSSLGGRGVKFVKSRWQRCQVYQVWVAEMSTLSILGGRDVKLVKSGWQSRWCSLRRRYSMWLCRSVGDECRGGGGGNEWGARWRCFWCRYSRCSPIMVEEERAGLDEWVQAGGARNSSRSSLMSSLSLLRISSSLLQVPDAVGWSEWWGIMVTGC